MMAGGSPASFTVLWSSDDCESFKARHKPGARLRTLFGGWNRASGYRRAGVEVGDSVFPVYVAKRTLYVIGRMIVDTIAEDGTTETLRGAFGTNVYFDLPVPADVLGRWRFASPRGERQIKFLCDGQLTRSNSFQGIYRLTPATATELLGLLIDREAHMLR